MVILPIILPKTNLADVVSTSVVQCPIAATRTVILHACQCRFDGIDGACTQYTPYSVICIMLTHWLSTHVSLLPPPCDEFTTSDPRVNATRVSPPGTTVTLSPYNT